MRTVQDAQKRAITFNVSLYLEATYYFRFSPVDLVSDSDTWIYGDSTSRTGQTSARRNAAPEQ
jgi:hypothetical protein